MESTQNASATTERFQSAEETLAKARSALETAEGAVHRAAEVSEGVDEAKRNPFVVGLVLAIVAAVIAAIVMAVRSD